MKKLVCILFVVVATVALQSVQAQSLATFTIDNQTSCAMDLVVDLVTGTRSCSAPISQTDVVAVAANSSYTYNAPAGKRAVYFRLHSSSTNVITYTCGTVNAYYPHLPCLPAPNYVAYFQDQVGSTFIIVEDFIVGE